jgi:hypothetical protein
MPYGRSELPQILVHRIGRGSGPEALPVRNRPPEGHHGHARGCRGGPADLLRPRRAPDATRRSVTKVARHSESYRKVASKPPDAVSLWTGESTPPRTRYTTERNGQGAAVDRLSPGRAGFSRSERRVQEMLPPDTPAYLVPIIEALLSGQTDEAACRRLGISPRTFSRRVAELLDFLKATTRFQGGAELMRRGCRECFCQYDGWAASRFPVS